MSVIVWIVEGTWPACADAARAHAPTDAEVVLLHVRGDDVPGVAHGAFAGLLGRGGAEPDPAAELDGVGAAAGRELLDAAARRLGRPCTLRERHGRVEREVVAAAQGAELLVMARDGDHGQLGPHSLGPAGRFVVDHAPCPVLLVWPWPVPGLTALPPPPGAHSPGAPPPPGGRPRPGGPPPPEPPHPARPPHRSPPHPPGPPPPGPPPQDPRLPPGPVHP